MAYLPMTQDVIKFMNKDFDKDDIISYQMLITLFGNLFNNEKDFLNDPSDRMGLSHFVENFLRKNDFQTIVTIKDLNLIFNNNAEYDIYDKELYKVFFTLIYEELSSNDPSISFKIKEAVFHLIDLIEKSVSEIESQQQETFVQKEENIQKDFNQLENIQEKRIVHKKNKIVAKVKQNKKSQINLDNLHSEENSSFVIHNKNYLFEYIRIKNLLPYECSVCGLYEWQNEPLKLELDSLDGVYTNTNLSNLRLLCPNCYSQIGHN